MRRVLCMAVALGMLAAVAAYAAPVTLYVAPDGNDAWSGRAPKANAAKTDGPLASVIAARDAIRKLREKGEATDAVNVVIGQGTYRMAEPLVLGPADSGTEAYTEPNAKADTQAGRKPAEV